MKNTRSNGFSVRRTVLAGLAFAGAADAALATDFRWRRRPPPLVCVPHPVCPVPVPLCPQSLAAPAAAGESSPTASRSPGSAAAAVRPRQAVLDADIPPGVSVTVDGKAARRSDGQQEFVAPLSADQPAHRFAVTVEFPAADDLPPMKLPAVEVAAGERWPLDLRKGIAEWRKIHDLLR